MGQTVSFIIQKGGCGKTTTTVNVASYLANQGYSVLAVDMDPQGNLTQHFGYDSDALDKTLTQLFLNEAQFDDVVIRRDENLHILPNNIQMTAIEFTLYKSLTREFILRDVLAPVALRYDFILIDCPPNLGILSVNALAASTEFVLVVSPEFFPMRAIKPLYETYLTVKSQLNRTLQFKGVIMTMCDFRTRHAQEVRTILQKNFPQKLYKAYVRNSVSLKEASSRGCGIFEHAPASAGAFDYQNVAEEFLRDHEPARKKREYYDHHFRQLSTDEKSTIARFAEQKLSQYNRSRMDIIDSEPILREAFIIERNKIIEKLFPFRQHAHKYGNIL